MSMLERRLQVLLDEERFDRLGRESRATGRSVGAIVRDAIDLHFRDVLAVEVRQQAARDLLAWPSAPTREPDWAETKAALEDDAVGSPR